MSEAETATLRAFAEWLIDESPDYYLCTDGAGYEGDEYEPVRAHHGEPDGVLAAYAAYRATQPEPPTISFAESMMGRAMAAAEGQ